MEFQTVQKMGITLSRDSGALRAPLSGASRHWGGRIGLKSGEVNAPILGTGEAWAQVFSG